MIVSFVCDLYVDVQKLLSGEWSRDQVVTARMVRIKPSSWTWLAITFDDSILSIPTRLSHCNGDVKQKHWQKIVSM